MRVPCVITPINHFESMVACGQCNSTFIYISRFQGETVPCTEIRYSADSPSVGKVGLNGAACGGGGECGGVGRSGGRTLQSNTAAAICPVAEHIVGTRCGGQFRTGYLFDGYCSCRADRTMSVVGNGNIVLVLRIYRVNGRICTNCRGVGVPCLACICTILLPVAPSVAGVWSSVFGEGDFCTR